MYRGARVSVELAERSIPINHQLGIGSSSTLAIMLPISCGVAPVASIARNNNSIDTEPSPRSVLATRGWLEWMIAANSAWVIRCSRRVRNCLLNTSLISMRATSSGVSSRKSATEPTFQPLAARHSYFVLFIEPTPSVTLALPNSSRSCQPNFSGCLGEGR